MANTAEQTAKNAENDSTNDPGYCLQQCRIWAGIDSRYPDATTAWKNTNDRYPGNRNPPRGSAVYWTGGSHGYGHIAISLGGGKIRSTDAGGSGRVATVNLDWVEKNWGLPYAGWAWDINEATIRHDEPKPEPEPEEPMPTLFTMKADTAQTIAAGKWIRVAFVDPGKAPEQHGSSIDLSGHSYTSTFSGKVTTDSESIRTRISGLEKKGDSWEVVTSQIQNEVRATSGGTYIQDTRVNSSGSGRRLVMEINLTNGGTLEQARWDLLRF